ncbi:MAG TPA: hypothetical protein VNA12_09440 [Mycobacteriales bacterium]|nr:hypothetical protein [Mycobacteriales bacterium]
MRVKLAALCVLVAAVVGAPGAYADPTQSFTYVASETGAWVNINPDVDRLNGIVRFTPRGKTFTLRFDDAGALDGQTIPVWIYADKASTHGEARARSHWAQCVRVRAPQTFRTTPGREVTMTILGHGAWVPDPGPGCTGIAVGGTVDIGL